MVNLLFNLPFIKLYRCKMSNYHPKTLKQWHYQQLSRQEGQNPPEKTSISTLNRSAIIHSLRSESSSRYSNRSTNHGYVKIQIGKAKEDKNNFSRQTKNMLKRANGNNFKFRLIFNKSGQQTKYNTNLSHMVNNLLKQMPYKDNRQYKTERINLSGQEFRCEKYANYSQRQSKIKYLQTDEKSQKYRQYSNRTNSPDNGSNSKDLQLNGNPRKQSRSKMKLAINIKEMILSQRSSHHKIYHHYNPSKKFIKNYQLYNNNNVKKGKTDTQPNDFRQQLQPWDIKDNIDEKEFKHIS